MVTVAQLLAQRRPRTRGVALRWATETGDETVGFMFQAISRSELDLLKAKFPPTEDQWTRYRESARTNPFLSPPEFDPIGLAPVLLAATAIDPVMTVDEAQHLWDTVSDGEAARLFEGALAVCAEAPLAPLPPPGTGSTDDTGTPSTTPPNTESPTADT